MKRTLTSLFALSLFATAAPLFADDALESELDEKTAAWVGTPWGLGTPQSEVPNVGKINCGMFVGVLLRELGFVINHKKLQRQPAELIIKSLSKKDDIRRFRNKSMDVFVAGVREMGDGWYVLGLDNHVGFVRVLGDDVRFVHADYVSGAVIKEPLSNSPSVTSSRYRVIGKILQKPMLTALENQTRIKVIGGW